LAFERVKLGLTLACRIITRRTPPVLR